MHDMQLDIWTGFAAGRGSGFGVRDWTGFETRRGSRLDGVGVVKNGSTISNQTNYFHLSLTPDVA